MAAEQFNHEFWVAVATAAPVIGLASAVTADQVVRRYEREQERKGRDSTPAPAAKDPVSWIAYSNIGLQTVALGFALLSLSDRRDLVPTAVPVAMEILGMILVFLPTVVNLFRPIDS
jgi:hypothetical protein